MMVIDEDHYVFTVVLGAVHHTPNFVTRALPGSTG